jgi:hypothetical protein
MTLKALQFKGLQAVILEAFPHPHDLRELARFGLGQNLDGIVVGDTRESTFRLIEWAESHGAIPQLLRAMLAENPGHEGVKAISQELLGAERDLVSLDEEFESAVRGIQRAQRLGCLGELLAEALGAPTDPRWRRKFAEEPAIQLSPRDGDLAAVRALAMQYDDARARLQAGPMRTTVLEDVAGRMRVQASTAATVLDDLAESGSAGERLVAVVALHDAPRADRIEWLADRLQPPEQPFIGYYAALALRSAARSLSAEHRPRVRAAIERAISASGPSVAVTERRQVLQAALAELDRAAAGG